MTLEHDFVNNTGQALYLILNWIGKEICVGGYHWLLWAVLLLPIGCGLEHETLNTSTRSQFDKIITDRLIINMEKSKTTFCLVFGLIKASHQKKSSYFKGEGGSRTKPTFLHKDNLGSNFKGRGAKLLFLFKKQRKFLLFMSDLICQRTNIQWI